MKKFTRLLTIAVFASLSWQGFSQESCANALTLTPGSAQAGDSAGQIGDFPASTATDPTLNNPCNANYNDDEYWFEYTATADGEKLQLNMTDITNTYAGLFVLDNCPSSTPTCVSSATNGFSTDDLSFETSGLTAGTSYKIVITSWGTPDNTAFTLNSTVIAPPSCPDVANIAATNNPDGTVNLDWDDATAATGYNYEVQPQGTAQGTAGALVMDTATTSDAMIASGVLTDGSDYTLFVQSDCGAGALGNFQSLDFSYTIPPANDTCAGVIDLDNETSPLDGTTVGASNDFILDCLTNAGSPDVLYSITVPDTYTLNFAQTVNSYDSKVRLAYGATCPGDVLIVCYDDPDTGAQEWTNDTGAEVEVYITIAAFSTGSGTFTLEYSVVAPPTCPDIENISTTNNADGTVSLDWDDAMDVVGYNYEVQPQGVAQGTAGALVMDSATVSDAMIASGVLTDTESYTVYVQADCDAGVLGAYISADFTYNIPPVNDTCAGVIDLDNETSPLSGTTVGANNDYILDCLTNAGSPDVIYSITVPDTYILDFEQTVNDYDSKVRIAHGATCPGDVLIVCFDDPDTQAQQWINDTGAEVEVYITIAAFSTASGTFTFEYSVTAPPTCPEVENFAVSNITETGADFTWDEVTEATVGYNLNIFNAGDDPATATAVDTQAIAAGTFTASTTLLTASTSYDAYIQADCDTAGVSLDTMITFTTAAVPPACGGKFYDTGGPDGDFMNSEDYQVTISPDNAGDLVTASFVFVDNAGGTFDTLSVDIGDGVFVVVPDVAMGDTPVEYTSIAADGSLIFNFVSSAVVPNPGWDADITCAPPVATCDAPENLSVSNIAAESADFSWDAVADATNGYTLVVFNSGDDPATATAVATETSTTTSVSVSGLTELTEYDAYVFSNCDTLDSELSTPAVTFTTDMLVGFDDNSLLNARLYPNPTNGIVTINTNEAVQSAIVYSVLGQEVLNVTPNSTSFEINLSNVANGTYFVKATSNGATSVVKVIKQ